MKKHYAKIFPLLLLSVVLTFSCVRKEEEKSYIKKIALNSETIAVGIYKARGLEYSDYEYIAEALNIDGGIVYVALTDADVLRTKLENIDVIMFPAVKKGAKPKTLNDSIVQILKSFTSTKGKGVVGICNGSCFISNTPDCYSMNLMNIHVKNNPNGDLQSGLVNFELTEAGKKIFPELADYEHNLLIDLYNATEINILGDSLSQIDVIGKRKLNEKSYPLLLSSNYGNGKILVTNVHPETTPGMRWMIPRIVRWVFNKEFITYNKNVFRPGLFREEIILTQELQDKMDSLTQLLETGSSADKLSAMDEFQRTYPWLGSEKVRTLLIDKNDDVKLRAARYLVDNEYTLALKDFDLAIKKERSRKVRAQLREYKLAIEDMMEQN